jgi:uncharacterized protein YjbJ (UPF0337 family)
MTILDKQVEAKQSLLNGKLSQAKEVMQEQWDNLQNDELTRLGNMKEQLVGQIKSNYGDSWVMRHKGWMLGTAVAVIGVTLAVIFTRHRGNGRSRTTNDTTHD